MELTWTELTLQLAEQTKENERLRKENEQLLERLRVAEYERFYGHSKVVVR